MDDTPQTPVYDLIGVGIGPFNLSLAALADREPALRTLFLDRRPDFRWHPGLLVPGATLQVPFLADLVSLVDPTSPWSFLNYLRLHDRLFPFYFAERLHLPRREYDHYCRWVAGQLPHCRFSSTVTGARWDGVRGHFAVEVRDERSGATRQAYGRNLVLGVGTEPVLPDGLRAVDGHPRVWPAGEYLDRRETLADAADITVLGSGQSGAEILLDLLRSTPPTTRLRWLTRSPAIAPMEYSKLGLEHFTPDYTRYFHALPGAVRDRLLPRQGQLYKAAGAETLAEIHDVLYEETLGGASGRTEILPGTAVRDAEATPDGGVLLHCRHGETGTGYALRTDAVVVATGYAARRPALLRPLEPLVDWDEQGRYRVDLDHRVALRPGVTGGLYVQNAELHTHGVGTPDLGLGAHRAATILNAVAGHTVHRLPARTAFTTFGPAAGAIHPGEPHHGTTTPTDDRTPTQERTHAAGR